MKRPPLKRFIDYSRIKIDKDQTIDTIFTSAKDDWLCQKLETFLWSMYGAMISDHSQQFETKDIFCKSGKL